MTNEEIINILKSLKSYYNDKNEYCEDGYVGFDDEDNEALDFVINLLEQTSWIPVSERLPEEEGDYLVTFQLVNIRPIEVCYFNGDTWDKAGYEKVLAWMPLPKAYKEGEE